MRLQKISEVVKKGFDKVKSFYFYLLCFLLMNSDVVFATNDIEKSKIYTGTEKLIKDAFRAGQILALLVGALVILYLLSKKQIEDEVDSKVTKKRIKGVVIVVIITVLLVEILNSILGYYTDLRLKMDK